MSHTITVTRLAGDQYDDAEYEVGGECDYSCEVWTPCEKAWHRHPKNEYGEQIEWSTKRAPVEHQFIDGEWMVYSGRCGVLYDSDLNLRAEDITELGTYVLNVTWEDGWFTTIGARTSHDSGNGGAS